MNNSKKYYWIKLKTNFFDLNEIDFLLSQENGCKYIVLYQMMCLNTANNNGEMSTRIGEMIVPYNIDKIVRDTKYFDVDTVIVALELFKKLGLIYEEDNQIFKIANFDEMVGSETSSAKRVREHRARKKVLQCNTDVTQEIRDKSLDIRDKNIDKEYYSNKDLNDLFLEFLELRKKLKAVNSERAIKTLLNTLSNYDDDTKYKMIENSITNSWKGVFPLKENKPYKPKAVREEVVPDWMNKNIETKSDPIRQKKIEEQLRKSDNP